MEETTPAPRSLSKSFELAEPILVPHAVGETKQFRKDLDEVLQRLRNASGEGKTDTSRRSRERSLAITKIQEAIMWLGMDLKAINEEAPGTVENPYPKSYDPNSPKIEPTADGLKM